MSTVLSPIGQPIGSVYYDRTAAERTALATVVNNIYPPGFALRYGDNTSPGVTDMTDALNMAAEACREGGYELRLAYETAYVTDSLDFDLIHVIGPHMDGGYQIQASSADFPVILGRNAFCWEHFHIHGGWDGVTDDMTGDVFLVENPGSYVHSATIRNVQVRFAKRALIRVYKGAYIYLSRIQGNAASFAGLDLEGDGDDKTTTVSVDGMSVFSDIPEGFGMRITDCISIGVNGAISENTHGIGLFGNNRNLSFNNYYQENPVGGQYLTTGTSAGFGLAVTNSFGGLGLINDLSNYPDYVMFGNSALTVTP